jgi:mycofactocin precursor
VEPETTVIEPGTGGQPDDGLPAEELLEDLLEDELLVEEISIDGMCGVY